MIPGLTIGRVAKTVGVNVQTIRYYERLNLLTPTARRPSGYRLYGDEEIRRLRFIKNAQALGFTLREVSELLTLCVRSSAQCGAVQRKAHEKLVQVEGKVRDLQALVRALRRLIQACRAGQPTDLCPILQSLEENKRRGSNGSRSTTH
jgi:MerR family mercuric resistance operon transcriptional regulator/MerR family gold-responsive transcriptional activator of gol and ges genes